MTNPQKLLDDLLETVSLLNPGTEPRKIKRIMGTAASVWLSMHGDRRRELTSGQSLGERSEALVRLDLDFFPFAVGYVTALASVDEFYGDDLNKLVKLNTQETRNDN